MKYTLTVLALLICWSLPSAAFSSSVGRLVTPSTQEKLGLEFDLSAKTEEHAALVKLSIPKRGKLKDVLAARLSIPADDGKHFHVRAALEMQERDGDRVVTVQLSPELAKKAAIDLVMEQGRREFYYHVPLANYLRTARRQDEEAGETDRGELDRRLQKAIRENPPVPIIVPGFPYAVWPRQPRIAAHLSAAMEQVANAQADFQCERAG